MVFIMVLFVKSLKNDKSVHNDYTAVSRIAAIAAIQACILYAR